MDENKPTQPLDQNGPQNLAYLVVLVGQSDGPLGQPCQLLLDECAEPGPRDVLRLGLVVLGLLLLLGLVVLLLLGLEVLLQQRHVLGRELGLRQRAIN